MKKIIGILVSLAILGTTAGSCIMSTPEEPSPTPEPTPSPSPEPSPVANVPPVAYIDSILPVEALAGESISFDGHGTDTDGTVVAYRWRSNIDGDLSSKASFETSGLSEGEHIIYIKVQDNNGAWSEEASSNLVVNTGDVEPTGQITNAGISWGADPDQIIFTWTVTDLAPDFEYWVYPDVGFTENTGPFGSTPEDEAGDLEGMYEMAVTHFRPAADGTGSWNWYGGKPTNPSGQLALLAYDPADQSAYVVDISEQIDVSSWEVEPDGQITNAKILWGTTPARVIFTWTVTDLDPDFEYWVYPDVGFTENTGPFGSTPEDEAGDLEGMYEMAVTHFRPADDGIGSWNWYGDKPTNPSGQLALLAYDPTTERAYVVDISEQINTSSWHGSVD
ncbi:MAG: hypothetical protein R6T78_00765 [Dehalococcoidales bacterium]